MTLFIYDSPEGPKTTNTRLNTQRGPRCLFLDGAPSLTCVEAVYLQTYLKSLWPAAAHCVADPHLNQ